MKRSYRKSKTPWLRPTKGQASVRERNNTFEASFFRPTFQNEFANTSREEIEEGRRQRLKGATGTKSEHTYATLKSMDLGVSRVAARIPHIYFHLSLRGILPYPPIPATFPHTTCPLFVWLGAEALYFFVSF